MDTRRLLYLRELARLGSMREVADELDVTTSTVSQQIAALGRELGTALVEPDGRRVRMTPAGRRLVRHAGPILAAVDAARLDLNPDAEPAGTLRVAGFATAIRRSLLAIHAELALHHPKVTLLIREQEPAEALALLAGDQVDLALVYDFNLAPESFGEAFAAVGMWSAPWCLAVPAGSVPAGSISHGPIDGSDTDSRTVFAGFRDHAWIVNSRSTADEQVVRIIAGMAGFEPRVEHRADSLELVEDLILAGLGVGLLPVGRETPPGIALLALTDPPAALRAYAVSRRGHEAWPPLALALGLLR